MKHEAQNQVRIYYEKTPCFELKFFKSVSRKCFVSFTNVSKVQAKKVEILKNEALSGNFLENF